MFALYRRTLASYLQPRFIAPWLAVLACWSLLLVGSSLFWPLVLAFACALSAGQVCVRLATYRGRLVPGYPQVQLAVLATACLVLLITLTIGMHAWPGTAGVTPIGTILLCCALGCWAVRWTWSILSLLFGPTLLRWSLPVETLHGALTSLATPAVNLSLAALGLVLLGLFGWWLATVNEDRWKPAVVRKNPSAGVRSESLFLPIVDWQFDLALRWGRSAFAWNAWRWLLPWPEGLYGPLTQISIAFPCLVLFPRFVSQWHPSTHPSPVLPVGQLFILWMFLSAVLPRRRSLGMESLRPVTRAQFLKQQGAALLAQWFTSVLTVTAALGLMASGREFLPQADTRGFIGFVVMLVATELTLFAVFAWALRFKSLLPGAIAIAAAAGIAVGGAAICNEIVAEVSASDLASWWPLGIAAMVAAGGSLLLWGAYRSWLMMDLE